MVWHLFRFSQSEKFSENKQPLDKVTWKLHDERPSYGLWPCLKRPEHHESLIYILVKILHWIQFDFFVCLYGHLHRSMNDYSYYKPGMDKNSPTYFTYFHNHIILIKFLTFELNSTYYALDHVMESLTKLFFLQMKILLFFSCKAMVVYFGVNWGSQLFGVVQYDFVCVFVCYFFVLLFFHLSNSKSR